MAKCPRCKSKNVQHKAVVINPYDEDDIKDKYQCKKCYKMFVS
jgi:transposase-like protein